MTDIAAPLPVASGTLAAVKDETHTLSARAKKPP